MLKRTFLNSFKNTQNSLSYSNCTDKWWSTCHLSFSFRFLVGWPLTFREILTRRQPPLFSQKRSGSHLEKRSRSTTWQISATFEPNCIQNARNWKAKVRARGSFPYFVIFPIPWLSELSNIVYFDPLIFIHELGGRVLAYLQVCTPIAARGRCSWFA